MRIDFWPLRWDMDVDKWCFQADGAEGDVYNVKEMLRSRGGRKLSWQIDIHSQSSSNILGHVLYCWNIFHRTMARERAWQTHPPVEKAPYRDCFIQSRTIVWILTFCKSMAKTQMVGKEVESSYCCLRQKEWLKRSVHVCVRISTFWVKNDIPSNNRKTAATCNLERVC